MRYEVSIKSTYVPTWGLKEAFREFQSNAEDAERQLQAPCKTKYSKGVVYVENTNVTMPRDALLFGHTTKAGNSALIGQFGEGLKLACLAAVRAGHAVTIRNGSEVWKPSLQQSKTFPGQEVLTFEIGKGRAEMDRVAVEIAGVSPEQWAELRAMFLTLDPPDPAHVVKTPYGTLLMQREFAGRIFVKGVFVMKDSQYQQGYDLQHANVDRDRRLVERWDLEYAIRNIWSESAKQNDAARGRLIASLENQEHDTASLDEYAARSFPEEVTQAVAAKFKELHGEDAIPVQTLAESQELSHLGAKAVVMPKALTAMVQTGLKTSVAETKARLAREARKMYAWSELLDVQRENLENAIRLVSKVREVELADIDVVDFRTPALVGLFKDGRIQLGSSILGSFKETVKVLIHEIGHRKGGDGSAIHVQEVEDIWADVAFLLLNGDSREQG
jgi:hypothetical protein